MTQVDAENRFQAALRQYTERCIAYSGYPDRKERMASFIQELKASFDLLFEINPHHFLFKELYTSGSAMRAMFISDDIAKLPIIFDHCGNVSVGHEAAAKKLKEKP